MSFANDNLTFVALEHFPLRFVVFGRFNLGTLIGQDDSKGIISTSGQDSFKSSLPISGRIAPESHYDRI